MNSKSMRSFTLVYLSPLRECNGTAWIPLLSSHTGKQVCPPKSSFSDMSYLWTSMRSSASSGTENGNLNTWQPTILYWLCFFHNSIKRDSNNSNLHKSLSNRVEMIEAQKGSYHLLYSYLIDCKEALEKYMDAITRT